MDGEPILDSLASDFDGANVETIYNIFAVRLHTEPKKYLVTPPFLTP